MDKDQLNEKYQSRFLDEDIDESSSVLNNSTPQLSVGKDMHMILTQRYQHREKLLKFLIRLTAFFTVMFSVLLVVKIAFFILLKVEVLSDTVFSIIAASLFVEVVAVIRSISKALWDESATLSSSVLERVYSEAITSENPQT